MEAYFFYTHRYGDQIQLDATIIEYYGSFRELECFENRCEIDPLFRQAVDPLNWQDAMELGNYEMHWLDKDGGRHYKECAAAYIYSCGVSQEYLTSLWETLPVHFDIYKNLYDGELTPKASAYLAASYLTEREPNAETKFRGIKHDSYNTDDFEKPHRILTGWNMFLIEAIKCTEKTQFWKYRDGNSWKIITIDEAQDLKPFTQIWTQEGSLVDMETQSSAETTSAVAEYCNRTKEKEYQLQANEPKSAMETPSPRPCMNAEEFEKFLAAGISEFSPKHRTDPWGLGEEISPTEIVGDPEFDEDHDSIWDDRELICSPRTHDEYQRKIRDSNPSEVSDHAISQEMAEMFIKGSDIMNDTRAVVSGLYPRQKFKLGSTEEEKAEKMKNINATLREMHYDFNSAPYVDLSADDVEMIMRQANYDTDNRCDYVITSVGHELLMKQQQD
jgi:hypothetical protein